MTAATRIMVGHALHRLRDLDDESVHMVWTSPPYWGLRAYGTEPQVWGGDSDCEHRWGGDLPGDGRRGQRGGTSILAGRGVSDHQVEGRQSTKGAFCWECAAWRGEHGQEPSLDMWLEHEVLMFREVRRVLRKDGTLWLNCGDAYSQGGNGGHRPGKAFHGHNEREGCLAGVPKRCPGFKPKQRLMLPARLAIALQDDGWWLRDEIVWHKKNPMPSSVADRTGPAHEMLYMLSKSAHYFYDRVAIQEPASPDTHARRARGLGDDMRKPVAGWADGTGSHSAKDHNRPKGGTRKLASPGSGIKANESFDTAMRDMLAYRNKRSVWSLATEPFKEAHFATAPGALVAPCILAGTSRKGVCPECGAPWVRQTKRRDKGWDGSKYGENYLEGTGGALSGGTKKSTLGSSNGKLVGQVETTGWTPSCEHHKHDPIPATVLDPFGGSGTTGLVAAQFGRSCVLIELNPDYAGMAEARVRNGLGRVATDLPERDDLFDGLPLFESAP